MVWYNITAYNIEVTFVLRNNKEKVICNNKNAEGVMQMKCKKNLERAIVLGLILSTGVCGSALAYKQLPDDGHWEGIMNKNGEGVKIEKSGEFDSINVNATGVQNDYDNDSNTTTALLVNNNAKVVVNGAVNIINTAMSTDAMPQQIDNNNALFVRDGATFTINGGDDDVFIAAIGADGTGREDAAISAKYKGRFKLTGNNVKIIGSVDFVNPNNDGSGTENKAGITLNTNKSFWYGNEAQAPVKQQFTSVVNDMAEEISNNSPSLAQHINDLKSGFDNMQEEQFNKVIVDYFGSGELDLELKNGAEWVYNSNGNEYTPVDSKTLGKLLKKIAPEIGLENYEVDLIVSALKFLHVEIDTPTQSEVSRISAITLNGGVVNLQDDDIKANYADYIGDLSKYKEHHKVTIGELKGSGGIFKLDLDWDTNKDQYGLGQKNETENSDYIYIEKVGKDASGSQQIVDFDASKAHLENMEINKDKLYFANVEKGTTSFITASSVYSNAGNVFDYTYGTGSEKGTNGTDWYIAVSGKSAESNPNFSAANGAMYAGYALGTELDTLNKRMGEARYLEEDDGVWVRYRHSKTGWDDTYETNGDMFQLGFDNEVTEKDGKHYRGVAIDYTDADTNIMGISGEGEHERYAVSLYDTWLGEKGHYRDLVLRGGRINSDYDVSGAFSNGYEDIGGDYHQWFGSISAEWGRKNDMGTGWYFEPQVQAQLARVGGASYVSDSGVDVDQDGATSLIGRAGFRIGREYVKDNGKHDNFYIKADLLHEFAGDKSFSLTGNDGRYDKEYDGQETWCDVGIGADISLGKNSYFWADVERTFGADFDNTWQINGGFRWEF